MRSERDGHILRATYSRERAKELDREKCYREWERQKERETVIETERQGEMVVVSSHTLAYTVKAPCLCLPLIMATIVPNSSSARAINGCQQSPPSQPHPISRTGHALCGNPFRADWRYIINISAPTFCQQMALDKSRHSACTEWRAAVAGNGARFKAPNVHSINWDRRENWDDVDWE